MPSGGRLRAGQGGGARRDACSIHQYLVAACTDPVPGSVVTRYCVNCEGSVSGSAVPVGLLHRVCGARCGSLCTVQVLSWLPPLTVDRS